MQDILAADIYKLSNPFNEAFAFRWDSRAYTIPARGYKLFPQPIAAHGARKIAERVVRSTKGDMATLSKSLIMAEVEKVCVLFEAMAQNPNALEDRINQLNPNSEEAMTTEELDAAAKEMVAQQTEQDDFANLNPEEVAEQERLEALKENNPRAYRAEVLNASTKKDLIAYAAEKGIEIDPEANKPVIIEAIIDAEV